MSFSATYGILGCGKQAPKHLSGLKAAGVETVVVADALPELATAFAAQNEGVIAADSAADMMAMPGLKGVIICTPTFTHAELIRLAVEHKVGWLCEKPLCEDPDEAREIAALTEVAGVAGMVGWIYRFSPAAVLAHRALSENGGGALGEVLRARFRIGGRGSQAIWKHTLAKGGGATNEMFVHMLDLAVWLLGTPESVTLQDKQTLIPNRHIEGQDVTVDSEDWLQVQLKMPNGAQVDIQADFITAMFSQQAEIMGTQGYYHGSIQPNMPSFVSLNTAHGSFEKGMTPLSSEPVNLYFAQTKAFVDSVEGRAPIDLSSVKDAATVAQIVKDLQRA